MEAHVFPRCGSVSSALGTAFLMVLADHDKSDVLLMSFCPSSPLECGGDTLRLFSNAITVRNSLNTCVMGVPTGRYCHLTVKISKRLANPTLSTCTKRLPAGPQTIPMT